MISSTVDIPANQCCLDPKTVISGEDDIRRAIYFGDLERSCIIMKRLENEIKKLRETENRQII